MIDPGTLGLLTLIGTWAALDGTSVGQVLVSRPIVSAPLAGWILGDPGQGLVVGATMEALSLGELPAGGARVPEPGPAGVAATLAAFRLGGEGGLAIAVALGVLLSVLGGVTVAGQRRLNGILVTGLLQERPMERRLAVVHWACIGTDAFRGAALTCVGLLVALSVPSSFPDRWSLPYGATVALLVLPAMIPGGGLLRRWIRSRWRGLLFALGCAGGVALVVVG